MKCLQDPASEVRDPAAENLGALSAFAMRVDQLASDLSKLVVVHGGDPDSDGSGGVGASALKALGGVLRFAGARLKPDVLSAAGDALQAALKSGRTTVIGAKIDGSGYVDQFNALREL